MVKKSKGKKGLTKSELGKEVHFLMHKAQGTTVLSSPLSGVPTFTGNLNTVGMDTVSASTVLTAMGAGTGTNQRAGNKIWITRLKGTVGVELQNTATFAASGNVACRVMIVKVRKMPDNGALVSQHPTIAELMDTQGTTLQSDLWAPISIVDQSLGKNANYRVVYDKKFYISVADVAHVHKYDLKFKIPQPTAYYGAGGTILACSENHYIMYILADSAVLNNTATVLRSNTCEFMY